MTLAAGSRIGPYEIVSSLGAGGMGEVYRARDMRLKRDVALKIKNVAGEEAASLGRIVVVQSWFEELKRLVPVN